jgi:transcriptional regulator with XRE-family HTH domain
VGLVGDEVAVFGTLAGMGSVGERLRLERERQSRTIEDLAEATHIDRRYLEALERGEIDGLPGRAFGKLYIRAYADLLGFEPQPLIEAYDLEQRGPPEPHDEPAAPTRPVESAIARWRAARIAERAGARAEDAPPAEEEEGQLSGAGLGDRSLDLTPRPDPVEAVEAAPPPSRARRPPAIAAIAAIAIGSIALVAGWLALAPRTERPVVPPPVVRVEEPSPIPSPIPSTPRPTPTATPEPVREVPSTAAQSHLSVADYGVGRRVVRRRLEGQTDSFARGEAAWFQTQVVGGRAGESIRHVWLHDGRAVYSIELTLGGRSWRTHSRVTLGRAGPWTVEARDDEGRVLARAALRCE